MHTLITPQNGWTPIMDAAMHGHAEVIKLLLEAGATAIKTKEVSDFKAKVSSLLDDTISGTQLFMYTYTIIIVAWFIVP